MNHRGSQLVEVPAWAWAKDDMMRALRGRRLGDVLLLTQKYSGASQSRLATATGLLQGRVSELMRGKRTTTSLEVYERVADGLSMPDHARLTLGLAPRDTSASTGELDTVYATQSAAIAEVQRCTRDSPAVDVLAVRGLGLLGLSDSVLRPALARGATLRVLLLDPASTAARQRASEIGESAPSFAAGIELALSRLAELRESRPDLDLQGSLYSTVPTWRIIAPEPAIFVSSFGDDHEGHRSTMYKLTRTPATGSLWQGFRRFFDHQHAAARRVL